MDVTFGEDHHRLLDRSGVCNLSALRRLCVSILRRHTTSKLGAKNKRFKAAVNPHYLLEVHGKLELCCVPPSIDSAANSRRAIIQFGHCVLGRGP